VADGRGAWRRCTLGTGGVLSPAGEVRRQRRPDPAITIAFAVTKGERPELAVQKLTELGVDRIVPFSAERSVARWEGERAVRHVERLRRVAREAAVQSRAVGLPEVAPLATLSSVFAQPGRVMADPRGWPRHRSRARRSSSGPEAGFAGPGAGARLGARCASVPTCCAAETAAITAGAPARLAA
jgi:16S rRNA (uracil1498-N3)-methyltransferase